MRIKVKASGMRQFTIAVPTAMIFSPMLARLGLRIGRRYSAEVPDISDRDLRAVCKAVKQVKRRYGRYELVSVESSGGDEVSIFL